MKKSVFFVLIVAAGVQVYGQTKPKKPAYKPITTYKQRTARTAGSTTSQKSPGIYPDPYPSSKNVVYQYIDTTFPNSENQFPVIGNVGIGTKAPQAALEIKRGAGDTRKKNILLQLSNNWAANGQNEPSIMFSNGDLSSPNNVSYWTVGARVSGDKTINTPQTFKICYKAPGIDNDQEFLSVDSYQGRVKIGNVSTMFDGYKLFVEEGILTEKVKVAVKNSEDWFDNVFEPDYKMMSIYDLDSFIKQYKHLPDIPTTSEVMRDGLDLGKMNALLLKKVEELTKYVIELKTDLDATKKTVKELTEKK